MQPKTKRSGQRRNQPLHFLGKLPPRRTVGEKDAPTKVDRPFARIIPGFFTLNNGRNRMRNETQNVYFLERGEGLSEMARYRCLAALPHPPFKRNDRFCPVLCKPDTGRVLFLAARNAATGKAASRARLQDRLLDTTTEWPRSFRRRAEKISLPTAWTASFR